VPDSARGINRKKTIKLAAEENKSSTIEIQESDESSDFSQNEQEEEEPVDPTFDLKNVIFSSFL
jgi:hypothetical protein